MMRYNFLSSLNKSQVRENFMQEQLSDGKSIHRPSDNPVKTVRSLRNHTNLSTNEQFTQNLNDAQSWMNSTDGAMSSLSSIMIKVNELVISADDTKTPSDMHIIGKQVDELINQMVTIGNTKVGDRYIFGGQNDSTQPFTRTTLTDPNSKKQREVVLYSGDSSKLSMIIQQGATNSNQDSVNLTGADIFGPVANVYGQQTVSAFSRLFDIKNELDKTASVSKTNLQGGIGSVSGNYTGTGYVNYDVRIDEIDAGTSGGPGKVTGASYSNDGGNTWMTIPISVKATSRPFIDFANAPALSGDYSKNPTLIALPDGVDFNISTSQANAKNDVHSFRVPLDSAKIVQKNPLGGAATMTGVYTGNGNDKYSVRIRAVDSVTGGVTGAEYTTDAGNSWSPAKVTTGTTSSALALSNGIILNVANSSGNAACATLTDSKGNVTVDSSNTYSLQVLQGKGPDAKWLSEVATNYVKEDHNMQLRAQTQLGTRMSMYQMTSNMMSSQNFTIESDLANNEDIEMAKAITDYNTNQTVYKTALAVGAKIMTKSLIDFL